MAPALNVWFLQVTVLQSFPNTQAKAKKPEDRGKKRVRESSEETTSGRKGRGTSVSSADDHKDAKRDRKEEKAKSGFDKGLKAEKIIGKV